MQDLPAPVFWPRRLGKGEAIVFSWRIFFRPIVGKLARAAAFERPGRPAVESATPNIQAESAAGDRGRPSCSNNAGMYDTS